MSHSAGLPPLMPFSIVCTASATVSEDWTAVRSRAKTGVPRGSVTLSGNEVSVRSSPALFSYQSTPLQICPPAL